MNISENCIKCLRRQTLGEETTRKTYAWMG